MNPLEVIKNFMNNGGSLENAMQNAIKQANIQNTNPMFMNLFNMAKNGNTEGIRNFARNLYKEQGRDFDKEYLDFKKNFKN